MFSLGFKLLDTILFAFARSMLALSYRFGAAKGTKKAKVDQTALALSSNSIQQVKRDTYTKTDPFGNPRGSEEIYLRSHPLFLAERFQSAAVETNDKQIDFTVDGIARLLMFGRVARAAMMNGTDLESLITQETEKLPYKRRPEFKVGRTIKKEKV